MFYLLLSLFSSSLLFSPLVSYYDLYDLQGVKQEHHHHYYHHLEGVKQEHHYHYHYHYHHHHHHLQGVKQEQLAGTIQNDILKVGCGVCCRKHKTFLIAKFGTDQTG